MKEFQPTFREQYDKIVGAYMKNQIEPYRGCACFVGNLLNNTMEWENIRFFPTGKLREPLMCNREMHSGVASALHSIEKESAGFYQSEEILKLENNFLDVLHAKTGGFTRNRSARTKHTEDEIYNAMESTLLLLKKIHESKGEVVEDYIFERREVECES